MQTPLHVCDWFLAKLGSLGSPLRLLLICAQVISGIRAQYPDLFTLSTQVALPFVVYLYACAGHTWEVTPSILHHG
jgi:hypothetical protein